MKKLIFILVLVCLATAIKKKAWDSCDTYCIDPRKGTHCDAECKAGMDYWQKTFPTITECATLNTHLDALTDEDHLDLDKLMGCINEVYAFAPADADWEKFESEAAWFWFGCKHEFCLGELVDAEIDGLPNFNDENIHQLPFRSLLEESDDDEDAGDRRRRMARKAGRQLNIGGSSSSLTDSQKAAAAAELEGTWESSVFEDQGDWNPDEDFSELEAEDAKKGDGYDEAPSMEPDFDPASLLNWYGCAASGPFNACYNDADKAEVTRADGSVAFRLCAQAEKDYETALVPKTTVDKVVTALGEMVEELGAWDKKYGFDDGDGRRRALKMIGAH